MENKVRDIGSRYFLRAISSLVCLLMVPILAQGQDPQEALRAEMKAASLAAQAAAQRGPAEIKLIDQAKLALPEGYAFIPAAESRFDEKEPYSRRATQVVQRDLLRGT